ncbi:MAG: hypothetical protein Hals2KO_14240 [Halioglobus sp.]
MKYLVTMPALAAAMLFLHCLQIPRAAADSYPVDTVIADTVLRTHVDSRHAHELLQQPQLSANSGKFNGYLAADDCQPGSELPGVEVFRRLTQDFSTDTATALLIRCLYQMPQVYRAQALFREAAEARRKLDAVQAEYMRSRAQRYTVLFVPGWGYRSNGEVTGGNLRKPREIIGALGYETHLVALNDFGSVEDNAKIIANTLREHLGKGKQVLLASASSGGPSVAMALNEADIFSHPALAGWINICGVLRGSPIIDHFTPWPKSLVIHVVNLFEGWTRDELNSLSRSRSAPRFRQYRAPRQLTVLNYVGVPFSGQVSDMGRTLYRLLRKQGPNDGLTLIPDAIAPGYTIMAIGTDHFIREDPEIDLKTAALLSVLIRLIESSVPGLPGNQAQASAPPSGSG